MSPKTEAKLNEILAHARAGNEIIPMFFQPIMGTDASVSAAIRIARKRGLLIDAGTDGCGKPKYRLATPAATHLSTERAQ
jgi:hypothetical protein